MASGIPRPSQTRWRLLPSFARSVGLGPVWTPQKPHESNNCPVQLVTNQSAHSGRASPAKRSGSVARCLPLASRADAANRSCQSRSPTLSAASAKESRFAVRTECPSDRLGPIDVVCHLWFVLWSWKKRCDQIPQGSGKKSTRHESSVRVTGMFQATTRRSQQGGFVTRS